MVERVISISQLDIEGENKAVARTDASGVYTVTLDGPGTYRFSFGNDWANSLYFKRDVPEQESVRLDFELPTSTLTGTITRSDGTPYADSNVYLSLEDGREGGGALVRGNRIVQSDANGAFEFENLPEGSYLLRAGGVEYWERDEVDRPDARELVAGIEVVAGEETKPVTVRLRPAGRIKGTVVDSAGLAVASASIRILDQEERSVQIWSMTNTDSVGQFDAVGLPPDKLIVRATSQKGEGQAEVRVTEGGVSEVRIVLD